MAIRTTAAAVRKVIQTDSSIDVSPLMDVASELVDKVSAEDSDSVMTAGMLRHLETYLAAHFYAFRDPQYSEKKTGDASATFQTGQSGKGAFEQNDWGRMAMALDLTGYLRKINKGVVTAEVIWLGLPPSEQTDYEDRD